MNIIPQLKLIEVYNLDITKIQKLFDKECFNTYTDQNQEGGFDSYECDWYGIGMFLNSTCNFELVKDYPQYLELISYLKDLKAFSGLLNVFGPESIIPEHTDDDRINSKSVLRAFIPLEENYDFKFSGTVLKEDNSFQRIKLDSTDRYFIFQPMQPHYYENNTDKKQYFLIIDILNKESISEEEYKSFMNLYINMALEEYLS